MIIFVEVKLRTQDKYGEPSEAVTINKRKTEMKHEGKNKKRVRNGGENMKFEAMFQPIQIGPMTVANRFVMSPMGNNFANTDGTMSERSASYYGARAKGGFGLITFEATVVYKEAKGGPRKPCLYDDSTVSSFQAAIAACHQAGAKVSIQLQLTDPELKSRDRVVKKSEKNSLYAAMDIAAIWLERALAGKEK